MKSKEFKNYFNNKYPSDHTFTVQSHSIEWIWLTCENCSQTIKFNKSTETLNKEMPDCKEVNQ